VFYHEKTFFVAVLLQGYCCRIITCTDGVTGCTKVLSEMFPSFQDMFSRVMCCLKTVKVLKWATQNLLSR